MGLQLVTPPTLEPWDITEVRAHCRIFDSSEDELLNLYATGARVMMEAQRYPGLGIAFITQTWNLILDKFPDSPAEFIEVPIKPVQQVVSITYTDLNGNVVTWPSNQYTVDIYPPDGPGTNPGARILPITPGSPFGAWPVTSTFGLQPINAVTVQVKAGFGDTPNFVPLPLIIAHHMLTGTLYENREATGDTANVAAGAIKRPVMIPFGYDMLTSLYRGAGFA